MAQQNQPNQPNLFELTGDATISYSTSSFAGPPQFSYHDSQFNVQVSGAEIRTADSELGKLVTVSLLKTVDVGFTTFTLLPSQHAALQSYKALKLHGTAKHVEF